MNPEERARGDLRDLRSNLRALVVSARGAFPVNIGQRSHLRFMLAAFAVKQSEHANSLLMLRSSPDTMLIARTMLEGLSQILWAAKRPKQRPLLWRSFAFVADWRQMQRQLANGLSIDPVIERGIRTGLRRFGHKFHTKEARTARLLGRALPADPYVKNWYGERESEILRDVGGEDLFEARIRSVFGVASLAHWCHRPTHVVRPEIRVFHNARCKSGQRCNGDSMRIPVSLANDATVERTLSPSDGSRNPEPTISSIEDRKAQAVRCRKLPRSFTAHVILAGHRTSLPHSAVDLLNRNRIHRHHSNLNPHLCGTSLLAISKFPEHG